MVESSSSQEDLQRQSLIEHLRDLRICLVRSVWTILIGFVACFYFSEHIFHFIRQPIEQYLPMGGLVFTAPQDKFLAHVKVSFLAALVITCPVWLYHVWGFIAPALYKHERKHGIKFIIAGSILFSMGFAFMYFMVLPMGFKFLLLFGGSEDKAMITIDEYLSFFMMMSLVFGLAFEMPLVLVVLGRLGIIDQQMLRANRRYAILIMAVVAAVTTPPDAMSMLALLIPLCVLYEISILVIGKRPA